MPLNAADPGKAPLRGGTAQLQKAARAKAHQGEEWLVPATGWVYSWERRLNPLAQASVCAEGSANNFLVPNLFI